jgi:hypothetical protein
MYKKIILISLDTLRADCINFNPVNFYKKEYQDIQVSLKDSYLDSVCKKACFFNNAISVAPYTSASHAAYFTGLWPKNNGLYDQFNSKLKAKNIFQYFKSAGYHTIFKTDFPFVLGKYLNLIRGVDEYYIEDEKKALKALKKPGKSLSFFHFGQIHYPYGFHSLKLAKHDYQKKVAQLEKKYHLKTESMNLEDMAVETFRTREDLKYLYRYKKIISFLYGNRLDDDLFNLYLEGINYFHKNKFNDFLKNLLIQIEGEDHLVVIFSDHGEAWNDGCYGHHNSLDESVIRVPLILLANNIKPRLYQNRIRTVDLTPTLMDFAGIKPDRKLDGDSLSDIIINNKQENNRSAFSAVWVNESKDVLKNVKDLEAEDKFKNDRKISVKYAACYYQDNYKYIENYKIFANRSSEIVDNKKIELYLLKEADRLKLIKDSELSKFLSVKLNRLNRINKKGGISSINQNLRKYFKLQGYHI